MIVLSLIPFLSISLWNFIFVGSKSRPVPCPRSGTKRTRHFFTPSLPTALPAVSGLSRVHSRVSLSLSPSLPLSLSPPLSFSIPLGDANRSETFCSDELYESILLAFAGRIFVSNLTSPRGDYFSPARARLLFH